MRRLVSGFNGVVIMAGLGLSGSGCASTERYFCESLASTNTLVTVNSSPQGAVGKFKDGRVVTTPVLMVLKSNEPVSIVFTKDGYAPVEVNLRPWINPWVFGNIITGGLGLFFDLEQGATRSLYPRNVQLELRPPPSSKPKGEKDGAGL